MVQGGDTFTGLERQRVQLEKHISELRNSIYQWRIWNAEYDGLKEEISSLGEDSTTDDILEIGREFGGTLVTEDEVRVLLGEEKAGPQSAASRSAPRSRQQIIDAIGRRIDYVLENLRVLEKRVSVAEEKLNAILVVEQPDVGVNEEGLPMTEIVEELDEDGEVISGSTSLPGRSAEELLDVLKKAGVDDVLEGDTGESVDKKDAGKGKSGETFTPKGGSARQNSGLNDHDRSSQEKQEKPRAQSQIKTQTGDHNAHLETRATQDTPSSVPRAPTVGSRITVDSKTVKEAEDDADIPMVTEVDESPEDAAFRKEMIQYGLEEVGAVVAELEMDESGSEFSIDEDEYVMSGDDEDEDEYGRATGPVLGDDYLQQMRELEKKLNAKSIRNVGSDPSSLPLEVRTELEPNLSALKSPGTEDAKDKTVKKKKKVAFADQLDIAPEPSPAPAPEPASSVTQKREPARTPKVPEVPAVQDEIIERTERDGKQKTQETKPAKKASRFKSSRNIQASPAAETVRTESTTGMPGFHPSKAPSTQPQLFPATPATPKPFSQPIVDPDQHQQATNQDVSNPRSTPFDTNNKNDGKILADTLVERTLERDSAHPPDPDELDDSLHRQEIATEFYKIRNRKVQQSGGFLQDDEVESIVLLDDDAQESNEVTTKKVSRFKAARIK